MISSHLCPSWAFVLLRSVALSGLLLCFHASSAEEVAEHWTEPLAGRFLRGPVGSHDLRRRDGWHRRAAVDTSRSSRRDRQDWQEFWPRLPGEFETQSALLLGCHELAYAMPDLMAGIVAETRGQLTVIAMIHGVQDQRLVESVLAQRGIARWHVRFLDIPHNTMWARDYGPVMVEKPVGFYSVVDASYARMERDDDDNVPKQLANLAALPVTETPLILDGGNLISNGQGLCLGTTRLLEENLSSGFGERTVRQTLFELYGATQVIFLEPLLEEPTGHVDMFATFTSADTVVVGSYDAAVDPANAAVLDRNAHRLMNVRTPSGRLHVVRIPMPSRHGEVWRTYTNVVYANGVVLMPIYPASDADTQPEAMLALSRLLPGRRVIGIDAEQIVQLGGALHCVAMNLVGIHQLQFEPGQQHRRIGADLRPWNVPDDFTTRPLMRLAGHVPH